MKLTDSIEKEIKRYAILLESRPPKEGHLAEDFWDYRARRWHDDLQYKDNEERSQKRVDGVIRYLIEQGVLNKDKITTDDSCGPKNDKIPGVDSCSSIKDIILTDDSRDPKNTEIPVADSRGPKNNRTVLDIGCGLGRFTEAMARYSDHVTGMDVSETMLAYAKSYCREQGTSNVKWLHMDFKEPYWNELTEKYDLVFASQTPAICDLASLKRMIELSRGWCFLSRFNYRDNNLFEETAHDLFDTVIMRDSDRRDGRRTYAIWNILWLMGYTPQIQYYRVEGVSRYRATPELADEIAGRLLLSEEDKATASGRILDYLKGRADKDGEINAETKDEFAWFLWDVRTKHSRENYTKAEIDI